ncbi:hypothetical protein CYLTODRAFT_358404 [Cylindrobasidium torrendii FP15055 ss-10]|uniref:Uncharacterized protein n=1 Tax=Cylindrobasidium torrendii FP15055 ss-10 TaxID=1314674 RepID=A0A0D7B1I1_9AGAR|nr:hypothetical protein CYLTODRAFT_358404 [Cylindrobasidium torrendii FP15055 ss-10]
MTLSLRRRLVFAIIVLGLVALLRNVLFLPAISFTASTILSTHPTAPPSWDWLRKWQSDLPQHNMNAPAPDGQSGRFVRFSNQAQMLGWNNILTDTLLNAHIAHESGRGMVFQDYIWETEHYPWKLTKTWCSQWPPVTPLNALLYGPVAGGPWEATDPTPRFTHTEFFDIVCPRNERRILLTSEVKDGMNEADGRVVFDAWVEKLKGIPDRCVEVFGSPGESFPQSLDLGVVTSPRILSLWDSFSKSPVSTLLRPSPIVSAAVERNTFLFNGNGSLPARTSTASTGPWDRIIAVHLRRGDYEGHCTHLANYGANFYGWNQLPSLPDPLAPPSPGVSREDMAYERCFPDVNTVVRKAHQARDEHSGYVDVLYILTNEKGKWLDRLIEGLREDGWATIRTSKELVLETIEQKEVAMAVDMDIARRAAIFVGNGWSSFTSNIVHRRLVDGKVPESNRFF